MRLDSNSSLPTCVRLLHSAYRAFRESLTQFLGAPQSHKDESLGNLIMKQDALLEHLEGSADDIAAFHKLAKELASVNEEVKTLKSRIDRECGETCCCIYAHVQGLQSLNRQFHEIQNTEIKKLSSDFSDLDKTNALPEAYDQSIREISRRSTRRSSGEFLVRFVEVYRELSTAIKLENKKRAIFLKRFADKLPDSFVPELKHTFPELPVIDESKYKDDLLPKITGRHEESEVLVLRKAGSPEAEPMGFAQESIIKELETKIASLNAELKGYESKNTSLEMKLNSSRCELQILKEKVAASQKNEGLAFVEQHPTHLNISSYYTLLEPSKSQEEKKQTIAQILKSSARQVYKYYAPLLTSKNKELSDLQKELQENKLKYPRLTSYEKNMRDQIRGYEERVKSYIDTIEKLNHRDSSTRQKLAVMKQELDEKQKDVAVLRSTLNASRLSLEDKERKISDFDKQALDLKLENQKLRGKAENLEKRLKEERGEKATHELELQRATEEKEKLKTQQSHLEEDLKKARSEASRWKEEADPARRRQADPDMGKSSDSGKREYLNEIQKKNGEIGLLGAEIRERKAEAEELGRKLQEVEAARDCLAKKLAAAESELAERRKATPSNSTQLPPEPFINTSPLHHAQSGLNIAGRASTAYFSQPKEDGRAASLLLEQKDEDILKLQKTVDNLRREVEQKNQKIQTYFKMLADTEQERDEKAKDLQRAEDDLDDLKREHKALLLKVAEFDQRFEYFAQIEQEYDMLKVGLETEKQNLDQRNAQLERKLLQRDADVEALSTELENLRQQTEESERKTWSLEAQNRELQSRVDALVISGQEAQLSYQELVDGLREESRTKSRTIEDLEDRLERQKETYNGMVERVTKLAEAERELEHLRDGLRRAKEAQHRYSLLANNLYFSSVKTDTIYKDGISIFVKYAKGIYIPLVFSYQREDLKNIELSKEPSLDTLDDYLAKLKKFQEQIASVTYVLDMNCLDLRMRKILEANSMVLVARVSDVVVETVDLKSHKELVSFIDSGFVKKVSVSDIISLMSASFDNTSDFKIPLLQTGSQNRTFSN